MAPWKRFRQRVIAHASSKGIIYNRHLHQQLLTKPDEGINKILAAHVAKVEPFCPASQNLFDYGHCPAAQCQPEIAHQCLPILRSHLVLTVEYLISRKQFYCIAMAQRM